MLQVALLQQRAFVRALSATRRSAGALLERFDAALPFRAHSRPDRGGRPDRPRPRGRLADEPARPGRGRLGQDARGAAGDAPGRRERRAVRAHRPDRGARRSAPALHRPDAGPPARSRADADAAHRPAARRRAPQGRPADGIRTGAHRRRHPRAAQRLDHVRRPRPRRRRRAAPVRGRAARVAARQGLVAARARAHGDADPAHGRDDGVRRPRRLDDPHHARGAGRHPDLRRAARREAGVVRPRVGAHRRRGRRRAGRRSSCARRSTPTPR